MRTTHTVSHHPTRWFSVIALTLLAVVQLQAVDLSGIYADSGTNISTSSDQATVEPSLYALLMFQFDAKVVSAFHDQTSHVRIKQEGRQLDIEVYDVNEGLSWNARWIEGRDYVLEGERVIARIPAGHRGNDEIILTLERLPDNGLLQVSALRLSPTVLGPAVRKLNTALFSTMP